jgi:hypothetical protein
MQISDDLFLGPAFAPGPMVGDNPSPMERGVGPLGRVFIFDIVPLTLQAAALAGSQNPASGASFALAAGTGVTMRTRADGNFEYVLDVPRNVTLTAAGANTATYLVSGYDVYGAPMTELLAAPTTGISEGAKAFKTITSITNANATAGTNGITAGYGDKFGMPVRVSNPAYVISVKWNSVLGADAGTFVAADATSPATNATGDTRGTYVPSSAADGVKRLVMAIAVPGIACGPQATTVGAFGVTQA